MYEFAKLKSHYKEVPKEVEQNKRTTSWSTASTGSKRRDQ